MENFDKRTPGTVDVVKTTIISAPSKSCDLDPLPTNVLKEFLPELLPFLNGMCNKSLSQGCLPQSHASVTPSLKKANADPSDIMNYRPISNLTVMSKVVIRLVCRQLVTYLEQHGLLPSLQSDSTETAVVKVVSDVLLAADRGRCHTSSST